MRMLGGKNSGFWREGSGCWARARRACRGILKDSYSAGVNGMRTEVGSEMRLGL